MRGRLAVMRAAAAFDVPRVNPAKLLPLFAAGGAAFLLPAVAAAAPSCGTGGVLSGADPTWTCTYTTVGEDQFAVPARAGDLTVMVVGADGSAGTGGAVNGTAAAANATLAVPPGTTLWVEVGARGTTNTGTTGGPSSVGDAAGGKGGDGTGGGTGGASGGGSSDIRLVPRAASVLTGDPATDPRLVVAAGGGGGGGKSPLPGPMGTLGGSGGYPWTSPGGAAGAAGGDGGDAASADLGGGGGGGGGWQGGAAGVAGTSGSRGGGGGKAGTSYAPTGSVGNPMVPSARVKITWTESPEPPPAPEPPATPAPLVPVIGLLSQASGSTAGGDALTIHGENFLVGSQVRFGGIPALSVTVDRFDRLTAIAPPHEPGTVRVEVRNDAGDSPVVAAGTYTYVGDPTPVPPTTAPVTPPAAAPTPKVAKTKAKAKAKHRSKAKPKARGHRRGRG
jgi:hypothetical protein